MKKALVLQVHPDDNVAVALRDIGRGENVWLQTKEGHRRILGLAKEDVPAGFKIALTEIRTRAHVIKYGAPIGVATARITPGQMVHTHNLRGLRLGRSDPPDVPTCGSGKTSKLSEDPGAASGLAQQIGYSREDADGDV